MVVLHIPHTTTQGVSATRQRLMGNEYLSDDSIEPATPPRKPASSAKILCPESSPLVPSSPWKPNQAMSQHHFQSAMNAGSSSSMSRTNFTNGSSSSKHNGSSNSDKQANGAPAFKQTVEQFRYGGKRETPASDKSSDLSEAESVKEVEPQPKKRKLIRGGSKSRASTLSDSEDEAAPAAPKKQVHVIQDTPSPVKQPVPISSQEISEKARRIMKLLPLVPAKDIIAILRRTNGDVEKTMETLKTRSTTTAVPTKTVTVKHQSNGTSQPRSSNSPAPSIAKPASTSHAPSAVARTKLAQPAARSSPTPPPSKLAREAVDISSDEGESDDHDREAREEKAAVNWFNSADANALMDTTNCSAAQAETIMSLRPFKNADDIEDKMGSKEAKGVTPTLFHKCKDLMAGYYEVDEVLEKCEKIGRELSAAMVSWMPEGGSAPSSRFASPALAANSSREGTPTVSTLNLSSVKKGGSLTDKYYLESQPPSLAKGVTLKDYQLVGVNWLNLLYRKKTSCILADEMGLGKTAQVISFFAHLKERGIRGPHLVVAPSSVLENWDREFRFFAPGLNVRKYYGSMKDRVELREDLSADLKVEVILTTYDMAAGGLQDHSFLKKFGKRGCGRNECNPGCEGKDCRGGGFDICVFDEGHMLKNRKSQKYEKLLKLRAKWRLLLTGTPLQNNLQELVSLLNFIMPDYFSDAEKALAAIFKVKAGGQQNQLSKQRVDRAKKMMHPFVLRRLKDKVLTELTTKTITVEYCDMTPVQRKIYYQAVARTKRAAAAELEATRTSSRKKAPAGPTNKESGHVLMELRKAANHPLLSRRLFDETTIDAMARDLMKEPDYADYNFDHVKEDLRINTDAQLSFSAGSYPATRKHVLPAKEWMNSGKIHALERLIPEIQAKGDRILIFSQFTMVLDILCVCLENMGVKYVGFTGSTQVEDRQVLVDQFTNDPSITVFLLSTKAGGLGINLVAANWVIMFDQDFNPQNDKQAADRCYRMGQTKPVTVVKLLSKGTIDEDIHALGEKKLELADKVSGEGDEFESDEAEQKRTAQTLLAKLRDASTPDVQDLENEEAA